MQCGCLEEWSEATKWTADQFEWPEENIEDTGQAAKDLDWCMVCSIMTLSFAMAYRLALLQMPEDLEDVDEMKRVARLANMKKIKGIKKKMISRTFPFKGNKLNIPQRKLWKKNGRLIELHQKLIRGKHDEESNRLAFKVYGGSISELCEQQVIADQKVIAEQIQNLEALQKNKNLSSWKYRIISDTKQKSGWLHKKGGTVNAAVEKDAEVSKDKRQATGFLRDYWEKLWIHQQWTEDNRNQKAEEMALLLKPWFEHFQMEDGRPSTFEFQHRLKTVKGCAGIDGWKHDELSVIASNDKLAYIIWSTMERWEVFGCIPQIINQCKRKRRLTASQFRPICVMSAWWKGWSSTGTSPKGARGWTSAFPATIAGGMPGAFGPEEWQLLSATK